MKIQQNLIEELEKILNANIDPSMFPYQKGNSLRIGQYAIRKSKDGFSVFDIKENAMVATTFSKTAAVAIGKTLAQKRDFKKTIIDLDWAIQKQYIDSMFYKHMMNNSKDEVKVEVNTVRYEIARAKTQTLKEALDHYIF